MNLSIPFHPKIADTLQGYTREQFKKDFGAGLNVMTLAFPLSMAFAISAGMTPEAGLYTSIIGGALIALLGGSRVQIGGPTGAFVIITASILATHGEGGLMLCTLMAGGMLALMGFAKLGSIIRYIPYPVARAFTKGIAVLILSSQLKNFFGLHGVAMPITFAGKLETFALHLDAIHPPTVALAVGSLLLIAWWPARLSRFVPGAMAGLIIATIIAGVLGLNDRFGISTLGSEFGAFTGALPALTLPAADWSTVGQLLQPAFTIALLVAMQALLGAVVTDGLVDDRHDSNQELIGQGIANLVGPLFGCLPVTGAVARSVVNVRSGGRTPVAALVHCALLLALLLVAAPFVGHIPLATLSAILVVAAYRMVAWKQFLRLSRWPGSDSSVFVATFGLTVFTNLTLAVEVGVVLAALLMVKRVAETSQITAVDEASETEGPQHSLIGKKIPAGVLIFRVFGAFFFGVVDKLDDELKRAKIEPEILILRVRKVLAIDATGLQALEDLRMKLRSKNKHLIISAPHTQPLSAMIQSGFYDRIGAENVCADITCALARAREILGLPPEVVDADPQATLSHERQVVSQARIELGEALLKAQQVLQRLEQSTGKTTAPAAPGSPPDRPTPRRDDAVEGGAAG